MPGPRYTDWTHVHVQGDRDAAAPHVPYARKLLGYLAEQRKLGKAQTQQITQRHTDGTIVRAEFIGEIPRVTIIPAVTKQAAPVDIDGFVTWPTDSAGALALPASPRVVLAGPDYRAAHKDRYSPLFPDYTDDVLGEVDGLGRAGNVDWHGKSGCVLSWYGPRTRYIDYDTPLKPWVFFKGKVLVDVRDYVDTDAVVLGAAIVTRFGGPWLVFVVEEFNFGRFERVGAVQLTGKPRDAELGVVEDSYVLLDSRSHNDFNTGRHPWYFSPDGSEARLITEIDTGSDTALAERIIRLVEDDEDPGFAVERETVTWPRPTVSQSSGYTDGRRTEKYGLQNIVTARDCSTDLRSLAPHMPSVPGDTPVHTTLSFDHTVTKDSLYGASPMLIEAWARAELQIDVDGDPWQVIAVDYKANGDVVYAHGRVSTGSDRESGTFSQTTSAPAITCAFANNDLDVTLTPAAGDWIIDTSYEFALDIPDVTTAHSVSATRTKDIITGGIRVGDVEVLYSEHLRFDAAASYERTIYALAGGGSYTVAGGGFASNPTPVYADGMDGNPYIALTSRIDVGPTDATTLQTVASSGSTAGYVEVLFLMHMDLRYDVLFMVTNRTDTEDAGAFDFTQTSYDVTAGAPNPWVVDGAQTGGANRRESWHTQGWIHGNKVLDDIVVTFDTMGTAPVVTALPVHPTADQVGTEIGVSSGAMRDVFNGDWPVAALPGSDPYDYVAERGADVPLAVAYAEFDSGEPTVQQQLPTWQIEVEAGIGSLVGYSFGDPGEGRVKVRWKRDLDGVGDAGGWAFFRSRWVVSMALPALDGDLVPFRFFSKCGGLDLAKHAKAGPTAEHFYPVWVLAATRGFRP